MPPCQTSKEPPCLQRHRSYFSNLNRKTDEKYNNTKIYGDAPDVQLLMSNGVIYTCD